MIKKFTTPTGKIKMAYDTIVRLEDEVNKQRLLINELINVLEPFVDSCYIGCSKDKLNTIRQDAEKLLAGLSTSKRKKGTNLTS